MNYNNIVVLLRPNDKCCTGKTAIFWDVTPCRMVDYNEHLSGTSAVSLYLEGGENIFLHLPDSMASHLEDRS
jgi:hypothetical protein